MINFLDALDTAPTIDRLISERVLKTAADFDRREASVRSHIRSAAPGNNVRFVTETVKLLEEGTLILAKDLVI
jgi:hypothetical protein